MDTIAPFPLILSDDTAGVWEKRIRNVVFGLYVVALATTMSGMEIFSGLIVLYSLYYAVRYRPALKVPPFGLPILLFVAVAVVGTMLSGIPLSQKLYDFGRMRFFLIYALLFYAFSSYAKQLPWVGVLGVTTTIVGIYGFLQHFIPMDIVRPEGHKIILYAIQNQKIGPLVLGTFGHHLTFSNIYLFYACLFASLGLFYFPRRLRYLGLGSLLFLLCIWTQSRAAWCAVPVTLACLAGAKGRGRAALLCLALAIGGLVLCYRTDAGFHERFKRTVFERNDVFNLGPRRRLWQINWEMFREYPLLGIGFNNNERRCRRYLDRLFPNEPDKFCGHAHSEFLQILATMGIVGLAAYLALWGAVFRRNFILLGAYPRDRWEWWLALGLLTGFIGFHIQGVTQWNFGNASVLHNVMFFWAVLAAIPLSPVPENYQITQASGPRTMRSPVLH